MEKEPIIIAGPCSAESREQVLATARALLPCRPAFLRAGVWKPRTRPGSFEGAGEEGLKWLAQARAETGLRVCTEVGKAEHVQSALLSGIDAIWIGARTTVSPFLVEEIASALEGSDIPVFVKNPVSEDIALWAGAVERLQKAGCRSIGLVHRGFSSTAETKYRNSPQWQLAIEMRRLFPTLPFLCDPSHLTGSREKVAEVAATAFELGLDGLMVEVHTNPGEALSDSSQQLTPEEFAQMLASLPPIRTEGSADADLTALRASIDEVDREIITALSKRSQLSRSIGELKRREGLAVLQTGRWEEVLKGNVKAGVEQGLDPAEVERIFNIIHEYSIKEQCNTSK